ncbi:hypothetical protein BDZ94DRAFT_1280206 [Collybia nuda]|uniref:GST N-terminal domain-containing protein n=1 Tax=Collybia nuda TaxID=64659 RepID=A0A9P5YCK5_9AGAR|nr:hypothetical protein BDZ94DRAFT_1280206 [Collybia nuda]
MIEQLTLYTAKIRPYSQRAELALEEPRLSFTRFEVDLQNKPEWYASKVNPASKVPAIAYGGPKTAPDQPLLESQKITESLILLEFVADISAKLLPKDPVQRARVRFFIDAVSISVAPLLHSIAVLGETPKNLYKGLETLQSLFNNRYRRYLADLKARDSFKKTFDDNYILEQYSAAFSPLRAQKKASKGSF